MSSIFSVTSLVKGLQTTIPPRSVSTGPMKGRERLIMVYLVRQAPSYIGYCAPDPFVGLTAWLNEIYRAALMDATNFLSKDLIYHHMTQRH